MDALVRVGAVALNEDEPETAAVLWHQSDPSDALGDLLDEDGSISVQSHTLERIDDIVRINERVCQPGDLTVEELIIAVEVFTSATDRPVTGLDSLHDHLEDEHSQTRFRLLLEDVLFSSGARAVALNRLQQVTDRHRQRNQDVTGLFDG